MFCNPSDLIVRTPAVPISSDERGSTVLVTHLKSCVGNVLLQDSGWKITANNSETCRENTASGLLIYSSFRGGFPS